RKSFLPHCPQEKGQGATMPARRSLDFVTKVTGGALFLFAAATVLIPSSSGAAEQLAYIAVGETTRAPIGWAEVCQERPWECKAEMVQPRDVQLTKAAFKELDRVNRYVNDHVTPMTDLEHYGVVEKWTYPEDGYGDCEDYVLLKRRMLMQLGWPREALLITVVRDKKGDGHAVLTVKTDQGEFVLDNQSEEIAPWSQT